MPCLFGLRQKLFQLRLKLEPCCRPSATTTTIIYFEDFITMMSSLIRLQEMHVREGWGYPALNLRLGVFGRARVLWSRVILQTQGHLRSYPELKQDKDWHPILKPKP